jgi:hypothetical protein
MKKTIFIFCMMFFFSVTASAQRDTIRSNKNEFSIGYGHAPSSSFRFRPGCMVYPETDHIGAFYVTYTRRLNKVLGIGVTACFDPIRLNYHDRVNGESTLICKVSQNSFAILPHLKINWLNTKYVNLYSKVAPIGIRYCTYKQEEYYPDLYEIQSPVDSFTDKIGYAYQFTPIGVEVGTKQCAGFVQVGIGMEGMISIGFRYGLKDKE